MSGILDSKSRVFDTIVTLEGRRRLAHGGLGIRYVSFSDATTFYEQDINSGSADATKRIYLEACNVPQDQTTFLSNNGGEVTHLLLDSSNNTALQNGKFTKFGYDPTLTGSGGIAFTSSVVSGTNIESYVDDALFLSISNFQKNMLISTIDQVFDDDDFDANQGVIQFAINDHKPLTKTEHDASLRSLEDIFFDPRFSNVANFQYLPPINKLPNVITDTNSYKLGDYRPLGHVGTLAHSDIINEHKQYGRIGYVKKIRFDPTSKTNNLLIQGFQCLNDSLNVLDVIDFGAGSVLQSDGTSITKHILFYGKVLYKKESDSHSFVHLFTMIFG